MGFSHNSIGWFVGSLILEEDVTASYFTYVEIMRSMCEILFLYYILKSH